MKNKKLINKPSFLIMFWGSILIFSSCKQAPPKESHIQTASAVKNQSLYLKAIQANNIQTNAIVVVPREGCGGCISEACGFLVRNQNKLGSNVSIVFTGVDDEKLLKKQVGNTFISDNHVKIDMDNYFLAPVIASSYPMIILLNSNRTNVQSINQFNISDPKQLKYILRNSI